jgi:Zn-dependent peptidase ImmA (M78 family)
MPLNPEILTWARGTAGLSVDEAARTLKFRDTQRRSAAERLEALEAGEESPSQSVLREMAHVYHRSLLVFYLSAPPVAGDRGRDFRRGPDREPVAFDPTLDALIRDIRGRHMIAKDLLQQAEAKPMDFVNSRTVETDPLDLANQISVTMQFSLETFRRCARVADAFDYLRGQAEKLGIFVLLLGNLGSYHTNIPTGVFRGYSIADPIAPFVVINDSDAQVAWSFTLLHEMVHLWLGETGISNQDFHVQIERFCNTVAGHILLPFSELREFAQHRDSPFARMIEAINYFAQQRKISRPMVAYRLYLANIINRRTWQDLDSHYEQEWVASQARADTEQRDDGGPSYYVVKRHRLGRALLSLARNAISEGNLTYTNAAKLLGVKPRNVDPLLNPAMPTGRR